MASARLFSYRIETVHAAWFHPLPVALTSRLSRSSLGRQRLFAQLFSGPEAESRADSLLDRKALLPDPGAARFEAVLGASIRQLFELGAWCYAGFLQTVVEGRQVRRLVRIFGETAYRAAIPRRDVADVDNPALQRQFQRFLSTNRPAEARRQVFRRGIQEAYSLLILNQQARTAAWFRLRFRPDRIDQTAAACLRPAALTMFCQQLEAHT